MARDRRDGDRCGRDVCLHLRSTITASFSPFVETFAAILTPNKRRKSTYRGAFASPNLAATKSTKLRTFFGVGFRSRSINNCRGMLARSERFGMQLSRASAETFVFRDQLSAE